MLSKYDTTSLFPFENVSLMESGRSLTKRGTFAPNIFYPLPPPVTTHKNQLKPLAEDGGCALLSGFRFGLIRASS